MIDFNKYTGIDKSKTVHTSGHARVANGSNLGAARAQSFEQRKNLLSRQQHVKNYRHSTIGSRGNAVRPENRKRQSIDGIVPGTGDRSRQGFNASNNATPDRQPHTFTEPPARHNPYS